MNNELNDIKNGADYEVAFEKIKELGRGKFGIVYEVKDKTTNFNYAAKHIRTRKRDVRLRTLAELEILRMLDCPNIIKFIDAFQTFTEIILVTEVLCGGELFERVSRDNFTLTEVECGYFMDQICKGVQYLHDKNIVHLDLKPENVVCCQPESNEIKIIDFGLARIINPGDEIKVMCGTAEFISPEVANYDPVSSSSDMWSVGVITYVLLSGLSPFMGENVAETYSNVIRVDYDFEDAEFETISEDAKDFIAQILIRDPKKRMSAKDCLNHNWLKDADHQNKLPISTKNLRRFLARRRWQRCGQAIRAMKRMSGLMIRRKSAQNFDFNQLDESNSSSINSSIQEEPQFIYPPVYRTEININIDA